MRKRLHILFCVIALIFGVVAMTRGANWYVDNSLTTSANNGTNWASAWTNNASISWYENISGSITNGAVHPGDTVYVSGGSTSQIYNTTNFPTGAFGLLEIGFGATNNPVILAHSSDSGHSGLVIFDGGGLSKCAVNSNWNQTALALGAFSTVQGTNGIGALAGHVPFTMGTNNGFLFENFNNTNETITVPSSPQAACTAVSGNGTGIRVWGVTVSNCNNAIQLTGDAAEIGWCNTYDMVGDHSIYIAGTASRLKNISVHNCWIQGSTDANFDGNGPDGIGYGDGAWIYSNITYCLPHGNVVGAGGAGQHPDAMTGSGSYIIIQDNEIHAYINSAFSSDPSPPSIHDKMIAFNLIVQDNDNYVGATYYNDGSSSTGNPAFNSISNIVWLNNTIVDFPSDIGFTWDKNGNSQPIVTNLIVGNNLFVSRRVSAGGSVFGFDNYNNTNFLPNAANPTSFLTNTVQTFNNVGWGYAQFHAATNTWAQHVNPIDCYFQPPGFNTNLPAFVSYTTNYAANNFHVLTNDTVAIGQGANVLALLSTYGISNDIEGNALTLPLSIGAFQSCALMFCAL